MVAILYEGQTDKYFLDSLLYEYNLLKDKVVFKNFEGKDNIFNINHKSYDLIEKYIKGKRITKILIIVDADNKKDPNPNRGYEASQKALMQLIEDLNFGIQIEYHIMCDENKEGHLESFLLSILDDEQKDCFEKFKECYKYELSDKLVYNTFYKQMKHPFDFNHKNFDELKQKLKELFN